MRVSVGTVVVLLLLVTAVVLFRSGPRPGSTDAAGPRTAYVQIKVLDARTNRWWYNTELYLKVESSLEPGVAVLLPVTVGTFRGQEQVSHKTPFVLRPPGSRETLHLEWLDDQTLNATQRKAILEVLQAGGYVVAVGGQIYLLSKGVPTGGPEVPAALERLARSSGKLLLGDPDVRSFKSFGKADYHVPDDPPATYQAANPVDLRVGAKAKAEARFYYPTPEKK
jgi:hypothetical protein